MTEHGTSTCRAPNDLPVVVIGGGQAGLAAGYYLRRAGARFVILDAQTGPGGAWRHGWDSLRLFSPATHSTLPGWPMPAQPGEPFPTAGHVRDYLTRYEQRYDLDVQRPVEVTAVHAHDDRLVVSGPKGQWDASAVISATGTWRRPHVPDLPDRSTFTGRQLHAVGYHHAEPFRGQHVGVVGAANSAAQILAEVSTVATTHWFTLAEPRYLPDDVDGRVLFDLASQREITRRQGLPDHGGIAALGDIVMVPIVQDARARGALHALPMFDRMTPTGVVWDDGSRTELDVIIWCTGFRPDLAHLAPLGLPLDARSLPRTTNDTQSLDEPRLHLLGYGDWTGSASATLVGAGRTARQCVERIIGRPARRPRAAAHQHAL